MLMKPYIKFALLRFEASTLGSASSNTVSLKYLVYIIVTGINNFYNVLL
jgi:hypothetical protein